MAIRQVRTIGDDILRKQCKKVKEMNRRTRELIDDMFDTMYEHNGVGLAASQVGILKQIVVIDVEDGNQYVLINPEIIEQSGTQTDREGCLSVPGKHGMVTRPNYVKVRALDELYMGENQAPLPSSRHTHTNLCQKAAAPKFLPPHNELLQLQTLL